MRFGTRLLCGYACVKDGVAWLRAGGSGFQVFAPWKVPLFSERYGHRVPILRAFGWRLFALPSVEQEIIDFHEEAVFKAILGRKL